MDERKRIHLLTANNKNSRQYNDLLYKEMREYGVENFRFTTLCFSENMEVGYKLEDYFIRELDTIVDNGKGYNYNYGGKNGLHSETTKEKMAINFFTNGESNNSYGKTGCESFAGKKIINITQNVIYSTMRECAMAEYGDIKYVKQISKVCDPDSNRFTYRGKKYALIDSDGNIVKKNTSQIKNWGNKGVPIIEKFSGKIFRSIEECSKYFNISTGMVRDRIYKRIKNDKYKNLYNFEIYN